MEMRIRVVFVAFAVAVALGVAIGAQQPPPATTQQGAGAQGQGGGRGGGGRGAAPAPNPNAMHVYIRAGLKSHGEGQHDYPQFLADWSKILTERGAIVDGSLHSPSALELENIDVIVMYKGDAGYLTDREKADLEAFVKRGGGIVSFHDTLCGPDPEYFSAMLTGGAKKHGETNFSQGMLHYTIVDKTNPIMAGMEDFDIQEEAFMLMTWAKSPQIHPLATVAMPGGTHQGEVVPQIWTYEHTVPGGQPSRAFVWMQGHTYKNFTDPRIQPMILRGISWAAKKPFEALMTVQASRGGRGVGGSDIVVPTPATPPATPPARGGSTAGGT
jgi:type 1 glutamine amidotransferase